MQFGTICVLLNSVAGGWGAGLYCSRDKNGLGQKAVQGLSYRHTDASDLYEDGDPGEKTEKR